MEFPLVRATYTDITSTTLNDTVQQLKDSLEQIRLSCARRAEEKKTPLLTRELQDKLLDIALPLPEDRDVWQDVWTPAFEVQDDAVFVYRGEPCN